jgi:hypothetical protein
VGLPGNPAQLEAISRGYQHKIMRLNMLTMETEEIELTESDYVLKAGSAWVRVNDLVVYIVNHGDRMAVRVFEEGTAYDTPLDAIEFDCNKLHRGAE